MHSRVEQVTERRPGSLVTWAVDRVRTEIGDNAMQYIKAIAFSALDVVLSGKEAVSNDTGEGDIARDIDRADGVAGREGAAAADDRGWQRARAAKRSAGIDRQAAGRFVR